MGTRNRGGLSENPVIDAVLRLLYLIRGSFVVFLFVLGALSVVLGFVLQEDAMSGFLVIWGTSGMIYAVLLRIVLRMLTF